MKTDIQIAQEAQMLPIREVAAQLGIAEDDLELYGKYKAKLSDELMAKVKDSHKSHSGRRGKDYDQRRIGRGVWQDGQEGCACFA